MIEEIGQNIFFETKYVCRNSVHNIKNVTLFNFNFGNAKNIDAMKKSYRFVEPFRVHRNALNTVISKLLKIEMRYYKQIFEPLKTSGSTRRYWYHKIGYFCEKL